MEFAKKVGVCPATISRVISKNNKSRISDRHAIRIEQITKGQVTRVEARTLESELESDKVEAAKTRFQNNLNNSLEINNKYPILGHMKNQEQEEQKQRESLSSDLLSALKKWTDIEVERKMKEMQIKEIRDKQERLEKDHGLNFS